MPKEPLLERGWFIIILIMTPIAFFVFLVFWVYIDYQARLERSYRVSNCHNLIVDRHHQTSRHKVREVSAELPVPKLELDAFRYEPFQGWGVHAQVTDFEFTPESLNTVHSDGEGYLRWYLDGIPQGRLFGESWHIDATTFNLKDRHTLMVELVANDHSAYTKDGFVICAATRLYPETVGLFTTKTVTPGNINNTGYVTVSTPAPSVSVNVASDNGSGWMVRAVPERFALNPRDLGNKHVSGEGHMLLLIDGVALQIVFNEWTELPYLEDGEHTIKVILRSNDKRVLVDSSGEPVADEVTFLVGTDNGSIDSADIDNTTTDWTEEQ